MTHTTSEILDLAADDIQRNGWAQGPRGMSVDGSHCALGAIGAAIGANAYDRSWDLAIEPFYSYCTVERHPAGKALRAYLSLDSDKTVDNWNDAPSRAAEDVVAALRAAAAIERVKETSTEKVPA